MSPGARPPISLAATRLRIARDRVEAAARPGHQAQARRGQDRLEEDVAQSRRRAEERGLPAHHVGDRGLSALDLGALRPGAVEREGLRVVVAVVLDAVAARDDLAGELRHVAVPASPMQKKLARA